MKGILSRTLLILSVFLFPSGNGSSPGGEPPYTVSIRIDFRGSGGSSQISDEIRKRLSEDLEDRGCGESVVLAGRESPRRPDLLLRIGLKNLREETRYQASIAQRARNQDPTTQRSYVAIFEVLVRVELVEAATGTVLRSGRFLQANAWVPHMAGEDAAAMAREEALSEMVRRIRKKACGGSSRKLQDRVRRVREEAEIPSSDSR